MPREELTYLSSRIVKEIARLGGNVDAFVPPSVSEALRAKVAPASKPDGARSARRRSIPDLPPMKVHILQIPARGQAPRRRRTQHHARSARGIAAAGLAGALRARCGPERGRPFRHRRASASRWSMQCVKCLEQLPVPDRRARFRLPDGTAQDRDGGLDRADPGRHLARPSGPSALRLERRAGLSRRISIGSSRGPGEPLAEPSASCGARWTS